MIAESVEAWREPLWFETTKEDPGVGQAKEALAQGADIVIAAGVESFFYRSNESAIEIISPMFDLGIAHPEVLSRRPDFADQIFSAGIILVRAHGNLGNEEDRRAVARLLVKRFPSKEASATTVPPKVIKLLEEERANIAAAGATIALHPLTAPGSGVSPRASKSCPETPGGRPPTAFTRHSFTATVAAVARPGSGCRSASAGSSGRTACTTSTTRSRP